MAIKYVTTHGHRCMKSNLFYIILRVERINTEYTEGVLELFFFYIYARLQTYHKILNMNTYIWLFLKSGFKYCDFWSVGRVESIPDDRKPKIMAKWLQCNYCRPTNGWIVCVGENWSGMGGPGTWRRMARDKSWWKGLV